MKNTLFVLITAAALTACSALAQRVTGDPGVRPGPPGAGNPIAGLTVGELAAFNAGLEAFRDVDGVADGLGPRFNLDGCGGCHAAPAIGGSSPDLNPQIAVASKLGARNTVPPFLTVNGPVREVRFRRNPDGSRDGGVHALFTVAGRADAAGCAVPQENFSSPQNLSFRIPTPTFGLGLIEAIPDSALQRNLDSNRQLRQQLGIRGVLNTNGNDGTVTRFGWKAQNKSIMIFSGEAYAVESGVTNELFPNERTEHPTCTQSVSPEDHHDHGTGAQSDIALFTAFMKFLDAPRPAPPTASTTNGSAIFNQIGCALCHTPVLVTGSSSTAALSNKQVALYSDLALHNMGQTLADDIVQGLAGASDFRTAPLWGLGKRRFLLHDGRTTDLAEAIELHGARGSGSEASAVIDSFRALNQSQRQDLLNFLRSL